MLPISTILKQVRNTTSFWSLLFVVAVFAAGQFVRLDSDDYIGREAAAFGFGGPVEDSEENAGFFLGTAAIGNDIEYEKDNSFIFDGALILGNSHPLSNLLPTRDGLQTYKVQEGDTLSGIAARFGISLQTVRWANPTVRSVIRAGEEITILPVSGVLYPTKDGDSLESIAGLYQIDPQTIKDYNPRYQKILETPGELLVLPYAKPLGSNTLSVSQNLPNLGNYFVLPASGWNWGRLHDSNAVDIADQCGKPIYASAAGLVVEESDEGYWNQGHGNYLILEHPNGARTRYSHTSKNLVSVGDYVSQGDHIALIGNTGNTHGPTGCHLHFEVHGARNPFAVR
ncbi:MAG: peptidoglycan DD-metalloendopeptidase family protein [Candidatus Brennerbacteria bacterium]|nr:peptidoglycan DD-metalloendopeptidase family protein [Candidatus Brennerbacteria bacterium]